VETPPTVPLSPVDDGTAASPPPALVSDIATPIRALVGETPPANTDANTDADTDTNTDTNAANLAETTTDTAAPAQILRMNFKKLQTAGIITPLSERTGSTEEFRVIKRQLLKTTFDENGRRRDTNSNIVMIGSSVPGEGKTFTSLNLAMSLSMERDLHVLLIDADNHRHGLSSLLEATDVKSGLIDLLTNPDLGLQDIILRTEIPNLAFIPAGHPHAQAAELLASKHTERLMGELATRYPDRMIIIDTPPLLASTEGIALSSHVGHAIIIVEKNRTTRRALHRALEMLEDCEHVSCIMNMETSDHRFSEYAYGY